MAEVVEELELPYPVPTHLEAHESIGPIPHRLWMVGLAGWVGSSMALAAVPPGSADWVQWAAQWGPLLIAAPFGAWWLKPPPEHGLVASVRDALRPRLLDPDRLKSYQAMRVEDLAFYPGGGDKCLTIWRLPQVNLSVASVAAKRRHRAQWGTFLDALGHEVQIIVRARKLRSLQAIYETYEHGSQEAKTLAKWMQGHLGDRPLISRDRLLVISAPDRQILKARCDDIRSSMLQFEWTPVEPESDHELEQLVNAAWPLRPDIDRIGPAMVQRKSESLTVDGQYVRTYALATYPATITTDWWSHLTDGDLPVDILMDIRPQDVGAAKHHLDRRGIALATSRHSREREVAMEQVSKLAMAMERSEVKPFDVSIILAIRANTRAELEMLDRRLKQRMRDRGNAKLARLTWEQFEGLEQLATLGKYPMPRRSRRLETGTLARTTPLSSATLQLDGGVVLGEAGNAPVLFTTRGRQKNAHLAVYGGSGAGKGYTVKVYLSREHFQRDVAIWGIDSDEDHEYAGRFCRYLHGQAPVIRCAADVERVAITRHSRVMIWDLSECPDLEYGPAVARIVDLFVEYIRTYSVQAYFVVDEAVNVLQHPIAAEKLRDLVQRGRHWDVGVVAITQLVSDFFGHPLGERIHRLCDSFVTFQQNPAEVDDATASMRLTPEEKGKIESAAPGRGLLVTLSGTRRVWLDLYEKVSPDEHSMAHTTPRTALNQRRRVRYLEVVMSQNGHAVPEEVPA